MIILAILQLMLSLLLAVGLTFVCFKMFNAVLTKRYKMERNNLAYSVLVSCIIFAVGYITSGVIEPLFNLIRTLKQYGQQTSVIFFESLRYGVIFVILGYSIAFVVVVLGLILFNFLTKDIDELEEIRSGNLATALVAGTIIIVISLFVKNGVMFLLETLIPYPELPSRT
jgi:uncharacterized membrane protein YjfL (UPF0719 family)